MGTLNSTSAKVNNNRPDIVINMKTTSFLLLVSTLVCLLALSSSNTVEARGADNLPGITNKVKDECFAACKEVSDVLMKRFFPIQHPVVQKIDKVIAALQLTCSKICYTGNCEPAL